MSSLIKKVFNDSKSNNNTVFVAYLTVGFPNIDATVPLMLALEKGGADIIELGVPFSDPLADGPTIQDCNTIALNNGVTFVFVLQCVREARKQGLKAPLILMGYVNPLIAYGEEKAVIDAKNAGANGFIVADLPVEENPTFFTACKKHEMSFIPLIAPTTRDERLPKLLAYADSFVYCVSLTGVTGQRSELPDSLPAFISRVRRFTDLPLAIGFGISTRQHFEKVAEIAEGVVIGSAILKRIKNAQNNIAAQTQSVVAFVHQVAKPSK